ncbi:MAG: AAA-like domain-containing protein [Oculatellaceae cyanobacterium bins.114]|nr:AAA-like domain-containing protein [Oculatellaceae cyanobacterium bins.114]
MQPAVTVEEGLWLVETAIQPDRLSDLQELIFRQCWAGLTYQQIAEEAGYDPDYVRVTGSRLWQSLSIACGEKITKNNLQVTLRRYKQQHDHLSDAKILPPNNHHSSQLQKLPSLSSEFNFNSFHLESLEGPVPIESPFYVERPFTDEYVHAEISKPGALVRIKAPKQYGKTSLLIRALAKAGQLGCKTARLNFHHADSSTLNSLNSLLRWFCANLTHQLGLELRLDDYWDEDLGSKVSCTTYLQGYLLEQLQCPLVLALDEVNVIFEYPTVAQDFLPLLRFWHEEANNLAVWGHLRMVVSHSTEVYVPLNLNQSPFNVGLPIKLKPFSLSQIQDLAQRHQIGESLTETTFLNALHQLTNGHPYLIRLALHTLAQGEIDGELLLQDASTSAGIYANHLQGHLAMLQQHPELAADFQAVIQADRPIRIDTIAAYKLQSMGLLRLQGDEVIPSCDLYRLYFQNRLS